MIVARREQPMLWNTPDPRRAPLHVLAPEEVDNKRPPEVDGQNVKPSRGSNEESIVCDHKTTKKKAQTLQTDQPAPKPKL
mmetsp:Transcript_23020/g.92147  ORF Transcript_23020/g.92147 Transcript_23020/m.92147 type:complete len:80 (-) Transcript_23020:437-676(-)